MKNKFFTVSYFEPQWPQRLFLMFFLCLISPSPDNLHSLHCQVFCMFVSPWLLSLLMAICIEKWVKVEPQPNRMTSRSPSGFHYRVFVAWFSMMVGWGQKKKKKKKTKKCAHILQMLSGEHHGGSYWECALSKQHNCFIAINKPHLFLEDCCYAAIISIIRLVIYF